MPAKFSLVVLFGVSAGWLVFAAAFLLRKKPASPPGSRRERKSHAGIALQAAAYAGVWAIRRPLGAPPVTGIPAWMDVALGALALAVMAASVWFVLLAIRTPGKQWSFTARLVEGHDLVTQGPYRIVRNPIYTGMLGMVVATGLGTSHWAGLGLSLGMYFAGTRVRVGSEGKLLRGRFGAQFEEYARRVPAVIPGLW